MLNTPSLSLLVFLLFFGMEPLSLVFQHYVLFFSSLEVAAFLYLEYLLPEASEGACSESLVWQRSQASWATHQKERKRFAPPTWLVKLNRKTRLRCPHRYLIASQAAMPILFQLQAPINPAFGKGLPDTSHSWLNLRVQAAQKLSNWNLVKVVPFLWTDLICHWELFKWRLLAWSVAKAPPPRNTWKRYQIDERPRSSTWYSNKIPCPNSHKRAMGLPTF